MPEKGGLSHIFNNLIIHVILYFIYLVLLYIIKLVKICSNKFTFFTLKCLLYAWTWVFILTGLSL